MADTAEFPYRIAVGWIATGALEGSNSYLLTELPIQSDQFSRLLNPWGPPSDDLTTFPQYARYGQYSATTQWSDGPIRFDWCLKYLTEEMAYYWEYTLLYGNGVLQTIPVTVKTRKSAGENSFGVYWGYANRAKPNVDYKRGVRGLNDYIQHFVGCIEK